MKKAKKKKTCTCCKEEQLLCNFYIKPNGRLFSNCKKCISKKNALRTKVYRAGGRMGRIKEKPVLGYQITCNKCGIPQDGGQFPKRKNGKHYKSCYTCEREPGRIRSMKPPKEVLMFDESFFSDITDNYHK